MGTRTNIDWCDHTFNPWRGCTKVSAGCTHCYAETLSKRNPAVLGEWGPNGVRAFASESYWRQPLQWNAQAAADGVRRRVFCGSMMDVFEDRPELTGSRERLFDLIYECQNLDWLLLTKRIENAGVFFGGTSGMGLATLEHEFRHLWLGTSIENQETANERIPHLLKCPAAVRFLSLEPLLEPLDLYSAFQCPRCYDWGKTWDGLTDHDCEICNCESRERGNIDGGIGWVVVGCESGPKRRPFQNEWAKDLVDQCNAAGVLAFVKQLRDEKNGVVHGPHEWDRWPKWARQEFPESKAVAT